jgi:hypothetical protein
MDRLDPLGRLAPGAAFAVPVPRRHDRIGAADEVGKPKRRSGRNILV